MATFDQDDYLKWVQKYQCGIKKCIKCTIDEGEHERTCWRKDDIFSTTLFAKKLFIGCFAFYVASRFTS
jgi:hypothetical protein